MKKKTSTFIDFEIIDWWVDWYSRERYYFCAIVRIGEQKYYIERDLELS